MLRHQDDRELLSLARELMETEHLDEVQAVIEARERLDELRTYSDLWDRAAQQAQRAQRLQVLWYGPGPAA